MVYKNSGLDRFYLSNSDRTVSVANPWAINVKTKATIPISFTCEDKLVTISMDTETEPITPITNELNNLPTLNGSPVVLFLYPFAILNRTPIVTDAIATRGSNSLINILGFWLLYKRFYNGLYLLIHAS